MAILRDAALLRHFLAVAREGSVSAAAQRLALSQPALTKSIRRLEAHLGVALFERLPRGIALTSFGRTLLPHARRIEAECHFAEVEMQAFRSGKTGRLRVGAGPYFGAAVMPAAIARLQKRFPGLVVELAVGVNALMLPRLLDGDLDVLYGALPDDPPLPPFIARQPIVAIDSRVVAGGRHPLLRKRPASAADLAAFPWAIYQQDRDMVKSLFEMMRDEGADPPRIAAELNSLTALIQLLKAGPYLSCVADALVSAHDLGLAVVPFPRAVRRFDAGALVHRALEDYRPATMLFEFVRRDVEKLRRRRAL